MTSIPSHPGPEKSNQEHRNNIRNYIRYFLNALIIVLSLLAGYFLRDLFPFINNSNNASAEKSEAKPGRIYQVDVLNGCGTKGAAAKFTNYLRANGYDVVEMKNYKTFQIPQTMIVDRVGNLEAARRIASVLGVADRNIVQQINTDYFVDMSVIVGKDYYSLRPLN